jgi:hypothetical protein
MMIAEFGECKSLQNYGTILNKKAAYPSIADEQYLSLDNRSA